MNYRYYSFVLLYSLLHLAGPAYADKYPRNFNIDILHYKFELGR